MCSFLEITKISLKVKKKQYRTTSNPLRQWILGGQKNYILYKIYSGEVHMQLPRIPLPELQNLTHWC